jgi:hypothetical protein
MTNSAPYSISRSYPGTTLGRLRETTKNLSKAGKPVTYRIQFNTGRRDSPVSMLTDWMTGILFPVWANNFYILATASTPALGPTLPPIQWVSWVLPGGVKLPSCEADHPPPPSAEVKNAWSYSSTPPCVFMAWCLVKHRGNFTFLSLHWPIQAVQFRAWHWTPLELESECAPLQSCVPAGWALGKVTSSQSVGDTSICRHRAFCVLRHCRSEVECPSSSGSLPGRVVGICLSMGTAVIVSQFCSSGNHTVSRATFMFHA